MRNRVIKPEQVIHSGNVVHIPDLDLSHLEIAGEELPEAESDAGEPLDDGQEQEQEARRVSAADQEEIMRRIAASDLRILQTEEEAKQILEKARLDGEKILAEATAEARQLRAEAHAQGYKTAREEFAAEADRWMAEARAVLDQIIEEQQEYCKMYEKELKYLALDVAEKILQKTIDRDSAEMNELIRTAASSVKNAEWVTVELSDKLSGLIGQLSREMNKDIEYTLKSIPADSCIVRTPEGVIDASVPVQLQNLRDLFTRMDEGQ